MRNKLYLLSCILILIISSCRDDSFTSTTSGVILPEPEISISSSISGIVTDLSGAPLEFATVIIVGQTVNTDKHGYFSLDGLTLDTEGQFFTVEKSGYFNAYKFVFPQLNTRAHTRIEMVRKTSIGTFSSSTGGIVTTSDGASISIPADGVKKVGGGSFSGNVQVYAHWYNPANPDMAKSMPGDLRGVSLENMEVQLATFGMMAVELESETGEKLQLLDGTEATLSFPLPLDIEADAPAEIPLWHFDESSGYWLEDGTAIKESGMYIAKVSHFSFWNCDAPFPVVSFEVDLINEAGNPLVDYWSCLTVVNSGLTRSAWSDATGRIKGKIPKNEELLFQVKTFCGDVIYEAVIGPYTSDVDLGSLTIMENNVINNVTARILDCSNMPLTDGYVIVKTPNTIEVLEPNANGEINYTIATCNAISLIFYAYDPINLLESEEIDIVINGSDIDLGDIVVCDNLDEYITFSLNGGPINLINDPSADLANGTDIVIYGGLFGDTLAMNTLIENVMLNTPLTPSMTQVGGPENSGNYGSYQCFSTSIDSPCDNITFTFTNLDTNIGSFVEGSFSGTFTSANGVNATVEGAFRVAIDQVYDFASISGVVWRDDNADGIRDGGEVPVISQPMIIRSTNSTFLPGLISNAATSQSDGSYTITGLTPGIDYQLIYVDPNQVSTPTIKDAGTDDTVDNDFDSMSYSTDVINPTSGENVMNVDLGILAADPLVCQGYNETCMYGYVDVQGGTPPYLFTLSDGTVGTTGFYQNLAYGYYTVEVSDAAGQTCSTDFNIAPNPIISGIVWVDQVGGQDDVYDAGIDILLPDVVIGITNSNSTNIWYTVTTDAFGFYTFSDLFEDDYRLQIEVPLGYELLLKGTSNTTTDNDFDPVTAFTDPVYLDCYVGEWRLDAGLKVQ